MNEYVPVRVRIRHALKTLLPQSLFDVISKVWVKTGARFFSVGEVNNRYTAIFLSSHPKIVQGGPFKGMQYVDNAVGSNYLHKLIGSYEAILHPVIEELRSRQFSTIIDIGSAEGYYLVGLGRLFPAAKLIGYEIEEEGRLLTKELYDKNSLKNELVLNGQATAENVAPAITPSTLIVCDCEGAEFDILEPEKYGAFATVEVLVVELHDFIRPGIKEALMTRFAPTHTATVVPFKMANPENFPFLASIKSEQDRYDLCRERGWQEQEWLVLERKR